jgi:proteasome lid subunit RPN8/RPN11
VIDINTKEIGPALREIARLARDAVPNEACGYLGIQEDGAVSVLPAKNVAGVLGMSQPDANTAIAAFAVAHVIYYHSHAEGPALLSEQDKRSSDALGLDFLLYSVEEDKFAQYNACPWREFEGLPWAFGVNDCYTLVRRVYECKLGIELPPLRPETWPTPYDFFDRNFVSAGAVRLPSVERKALQDYDVLAIRMGHRTANHLGIVIRDILLHHPLDGVSVAEDLTDEILKRTVAVYRHGSMT